MKKLLLGLGVMVITASSVSTISCIYTPKYKNQFEKSIQRIINVTNISAEAQILTSNIANENPQINNYVANSKKVNGIEHSTTNANINYKYVIDKYASINSQDFLPKSEWVKLLNSDSEWDPNILMELQLYKFYGDEWKTKETTLTTNSIKFEDGKKQGESSITKTASLASSILGVLFGSDFNVGQAKLLYQNIGMVFDLIDDPTKQSLAENLVSIVEKTKQLPSKIALETMINNPFEQAENGQTRYDVMNEISKAFWRDILKKTSTPVPQTKLVADMVNFLFMILWYLQQFDTSETISAKTLTDVLSVEVSETDAKNFDEIKIGQVAKVFKDFMKPGYDFKEARGIVNIFFAIPEQRENFKTNSNVLIAPVFEVLAEPSTSSVQNKSKEKQTYQNLDSEIANNFKQQSISLESTSDLDNSVSFNSINFIKLINDMIGWIKTENGIPANVTKELINSLNLVIKIIKKGDFTNINDIIQLVLNEALFAPLTDPTKTPLVFGDALYILAKMKNNDLPANQKIDLKGFSYISNLSGVPTDLFYALYDGKLFKSIFQLINAFKPNTISPSVYQNLGDLKSMLNIKVGVLMENILKIDYDDNMQFLYGLKNIRLPELIETIESYFKPNPGTSQEYYFDYGSLRKIIFSMFEDVEIKVGDDTVVQEMNSISGVITALIAGLTNQKIEIRGENVDPKKAVIVAMGLTANGNKIVKNSIFSAIAEAYGHGDKEDPTKRDNTVRVIGSLLDAITWMKKSSEVKYADENFAHFFNQKNWSTAYISSKNYENIYEEAKIEYSLTYTNKKYKIEEKYLISLTREKMPISATFGNKSFVVSSITRK